MKIRHVAGAALLATTALFPVIAAAQPSGAQSQGASGDLSEVVVTAQRRAERLTDVPLSISVVSAQTLSSAGVRSLTDLTSLTPGVYFASNGAFAQPVVRGVSASLTSAGADANVAIYIDGVYQPNQTGNYADFPDIDRIEVLKGPQGTLFGRNATGGAINIWTKDPSVEPGGNFSASYGRFNEVRAAGYLTAGLSENLAASISGSYADDDGYVRNLGTGGKVSNVHAWNVHGKLRWAPNDRMSWTLAARHNLKHDNTGFALAPLNGNNANLRLPGVKIPSGNREVSLTFDPKINSKSNIVSLRGEYDTEIAKLVSVTSYQEYDNYILTDGDRTNLPLTRSDIINHQITRTQEFNIVSLGESRFKWFGGLYLYYDKSVVANGLNLGVPLTANAKAKAWAPFAEINYEFYPGFTLIAGVRYNSEKKSFVANRLAGQVAQQISAQETFKNTTPRLGIKYALDSRSNVYAMYSKGFKSGLFDTSAFSTAIILPETLTAFEVGYKYGSGGTAFNTAAYYYKYRNIQFQALNPSGAGSLAFNAARAKIYGVDADLSFRPADNLTLRAAAAYTHGRYKEFPRALIYQPLPAGGNALVGLNQANPVTREINSTGANGKKLSRMPDISGSLTATYRKPLQNGDAMELSSTAYYSGAFYWTPQNRLKQDSYVVWNGEAAWISPSGKYRVSVWGRNLLNETYGVYVVDAVTGDAASYSRPRTYGARVAVNF